MLETQTNEILIQTALFFIAAIEGIGIPKIVDWLKATFQLSGRSSYAAAAVVSLLLVGSTYIATGLITDNPTIWSTIHYSIAAAFGVSQSIYFSFWKKISPPQPPQELRYRTSPDQRP